ncbi:hypothetical protein Tco_0715909 [Tanacetum coccineum]
MAVERTFQNIEDMLWLWNLLGERGGPVLGVKCALFEALYRRKCRTPIAWVEVGESKLIGQEIIQETTNKIVQIKERLKVARDHQKSYADNRRKPLESSVDDKVLLKVSPWKGVLCFGKRSKAFTKIRRTVRDCQASWSCSLSIALTTRTCRHS